jgi:hypothetical protein
MQHEFMCIWESQKERDHWEDKSIGRKIILKAISERQGGMIWTRSIWLRIGSSGVLL